MGKWTLQSRAENRAVRLTGLPGHGQHGKAASSAGAASSVTCLVSQGEGEAGLRVPRASFHTPPGADPGRLRRAELPPAEGTIRSDCHVLSPGLACGAGSANGGS